MSRILYEKELEIKESKSIVSFHSNSHEWQNFIYIDDKPAYEIGGNCETCGLYFERLSGVNQSIHHEELIEKLNEGVDKINDEIIEKISEIIPKGKYKVLLLKVYPKLVELGSANDYFVNEQVKLWGIDGFWGMPHNPKIRYYRGTDLLVRPKEKLFEFIIPIYPQTWLDKDRIEFYKNQIENDKEPTAISLSVLDVRGPCYYDDEPLPELYSHFCLSHYILDGHHKIFTASELNKPINLICFLAIEQGVYLENDLQDLIKVI